MSITFGPADKIPTTIKTRVLNDDFLFYDQKSNYHRLRQERDDMPGAPHNNLVDYLLSVLRWYYRAATYTVHREINIYNLADKSAGMVDKQGRPLPVYPDIVMLKSDERYIFTSYRIDNDNPPPELIVEIISDNTPTSDLVDKPIIYERWGIKEYFTYDPRPRIRKTDKPRLSGWRLNESTNRFEVLIPETDGRLWSRQLEAWLKPDEANLRILDTTGQIVPSEKEAAQQLAEKMEQARDVAIGQVEVEREAQRRQFKQTQDALRRERAALQREEAERQAKEAALQRQEAERQAKEAERLAKEQALQRQEAERLAKEEALQRQEAERIAKEAALQQLEAERQAQEDARLQIERLREELRRLQSPNNELS